MDWLTLAAGMVSVFSIARHEARKNEVQINLLKVLGADLKMLRTITLVEFGFIGFFRRPVCPCLERRIFPGNFLVFF